MSRHFILLSFKCFNEQNILFIFYIHMTVPVLLWSIRILSGSVSVSDIAQCEPLCTVTKQNYPVLLSLVWWIITISDIWHININFLNNSFFIQPHIRHFLYCHADIQWIKICQKSSTNFCAAKDDRSLCVVCKPY